MSWKQGSAGGRNCVAAPGGNTGTHFQGGLMLYVSVQNGTRAGRRRLLAMAKDWFCPKCGREVEKYWVKCPDCGTERPK